MSEVEKIKPLTTNLIARTRVAAYARVSIETDKMHQSIEVQITYFKRLIRSHADWEFVGIYADEGISGTGTKHRTEFNRLISDCENGLIDQILVKSISRFARNTVDTLKTTRRLRELGIDVYFERERIHSLSNEGELLLTLLASFAQEESRSISENVKWGIRKRFEQGIPNGHKAPYGYEWNGDGFSVIPDEAKVVKYIFRNYIDGASAYRIAKDLRLDGVVGKDGAPISDTVVKDIISNCSYTGKMILQKCYISENKKRKTNYGELPRYIVDGMFEPIVEVNEQEQAISIRHKRASEAKNNKPTLTVFSGIIKCGNCGSSISRRTQKHEKIWRCNRSERKGKQACDLRPITEKELIEATKKALNLENYDEAKIKEKIVRIEVFGDRIVFFLSKGNTKEVNRVYGGYKKRSAFSGKIKCGFCGNNYESDTWRIGPVSNKVKYKVWKCKSPRSTCNMKRVMEEELRTAAHELLGCKEYEAKLVERIKSITVYDDYFEFMDKEGKVTRWQRM